MGIGKDYKVKAHSFTSTNLSEDTSIICICMSVRWSVFYSTDIYLYTIYVLAFYTIFPIRPVYFIATHSFLAL